MQCPTCKQILDDGVRFCPHDGTPLIDTGVTKADSTPTGGRRTASRELDLPLVIGTRYRLEEVRGGGGMAKVYRATDVTLEREVAVKLINPDLRTEPEFDQRFQREARIASQLADPHIVVVHDFGLDATHGPYLVMEFLQGQSLRERLVTSGPLPLKAGLQLAGQLVLALIHAHGKGIVHRDIKPDNIFLLNQSGVRLHVRVLDFGIARIYRGDDGGKSETITHAGAVLGTPRYMSPEQLAGQSVDARSDLYSAALLIYESLTGQLPYLHGKKLCELCPEASSGLEALIEQCMKPSPDERPQNAVEVYLRLQELGKASGILLLPPGSLDKLVAARKASEPTVAYVPNDQAKRRLRRRVLLGLGAAIVLLGVAALAKRFFFAGPVLHDGPASLHGVSIGDGQKQVEKKLGLTKEFEGNPWTHPRTKEHLGHVLKLTDLTGHIAEMDDLTTMRTPDDKVMVLFADDEVVAVVTTHGSGRTGRGVSVGDRVDQVFRLYNDEQARQEDVALADGHIEVRRYPKLGLAFEIQGDRVRSITLYPAPKAGPAGK